MTSMGFHRLRPCERLQAWELGGGAHTAQRYLCSEPWGWKDDCWLQAPAAARPTGLL